MRNWNPALVGLLGAAGGCSSDYTECKFDTQCSAADTPCARGVCRGGFCQAVAGEARQEPGDCFRVKCNGTMVTLEKDPLDTLNEVDRDSCTTYRCEYWDDRASQTGTLVADGTLCAGGGMCSSGRCSTN